MRMRHWILEGKEPVMVDDPMVWGQWFGTANRRVAYTDIIPDVYVSTVFLGLDHSFGSGPPLLFETMAFGVEGYMRIFLSQGDPSRRGKSKPIPPGIDTDRYTTWDEAEAGHYRIVDNVRWRLGL